MGYPHSEIAPLENLLGNDKNEILAIYNKLKNGTATHKDISDIMSIAQQNESAFTTFELSLILRIAEVLLRGDDLKRSSEYIKGNMFAAFKLPEERYY